MLLYKPLWPLHPHLQWLTGQHHDARVFCNSTLPKMMENREYTPGAGMSYCMWWTGAVRVQVELAPLMGMQPHHGPLMNPGVFSQVLVPHLWGLVPHWECFVSGSSFPCWCWLSGLWPLVLCRACSPAGLGHGRGKILGSGTEL